MTTFIKLARSLAYAATRLLPKSNTVVLRGFPSYEDNLIAIYSALATRPIKRIVWVVDDVSTTPPIRLRPGTRLVKRGRLLDLYYSMTSKFLFVTHGHFLPTVPPNQISVNLWHGIPFKAIGKNFGKEGRSDTFLVATSDFTRKILADAFGMAEESVIVTGQARTDRMIDVDQEKTWRMAFPDEARPKKVFLWLPTYRETPHFQGQIDGSTFSNVFNCSDFSQSAFNDVLNDNNAVCLVKPHPMAARQDQANHSNLYFIDESWLQRHGLSLYQLAGAADCLISDVSSIIADFMLLDRPIILLFEDIEPYKNSRGFSFNPITDFLPANVACNFDGFIAELDAVLAGDDPYAGRRSELKPLFFDHLDARAADRILDHSMGDAS